MNFEERYQLQLPLSQREHGTVWKAHDVKLAREVALAVLEADAPEATKFEEQVAKLIPIRNANLVRVFDAGKNTEGDPYGSFELVDGTSLAERMRNGPPMKVDQAIRMTVDLLGALGVLHAAGIAHGDIEPGNVFVKEAGGRVTPKLTALAMNRAGQRAGLSAFDEGHVHVLAYASPEQAAGGQRDAAGDVYSLAGLLYSLLTGRLPHRGADVDGLRKSVVSRAVPALADVREELAGPLADTLDAALSPKPTERFTTADAFSKSLRAALVRVRNPGTLETVVGERTWKEDESDEALAQKRLEPRTAKAAAAPVAAALPPKAKLPGGKLPTKAKLEAKPKPEPKPQPKEEAKPEEAKSEEAKSEEAKLFEPEPLPFERTSDEPAEPAKPPVDASALEFESVSGLLEIEPPPAFPKKTTPEPAPAEAAPAEEAAYEEMSAPRDDDEADTAVKEVALPAADADEAVTAVREVLLPGASAREEASEEEAAADDGAHDVAVDEPEAVEAQASAAPTEEEAVEKEEKQAEAEEEKAEAEEEKAEAKEEKAEEKEEARGEERAQPAPIDDLPELDEKPPGMPAWMWGAGALAAAAVLGIIVMVAMSGDDETPPAETAPQAQPAPPEEELPPPDEELEGQEAFAPDEPVVEEVEEPPVEEAPEPVTLTLSGVPEGARVTVDGEEASGSRLELPPIEGERTIEVALDDHETWTRTIPGGESAELEVELTPIAREEPEASEPVARSPRTARRQAARRQAARRQAARRQASDRPTVISNPGF